MTTPPTIPDPSEQDARHELYAFLLSVLLVIVGAYLLVGVKQYEAAGCGLLSAVAYYWLGVHLSRKER